MTQMNTAPRLPFPVPKLCFGGSGLGSMPDTYGYAVDDARALATLEAVLAERPCFLDTSRIYGMGRSEARIGKAIAAAGGLPEGVIVSTKLDRDVETGRFDGDQARRSLAESLEALGLDKVHVLHLHDPEHAGDLGEVTGKGGALEALMRMKEEGLADAVGLAMGKIPLMRRLLDREADDLFTEAHKKGIAVFNAAPYSGGALAKGTKTFSRIAYQEASEAALDEVRRIEEICGRHGIPMGAAALQFSLRDPRVASTIVGVTKPERVAEPTEWAAVPIPHAAWDELLALPFSTDDPEAARVYQPE